MSTVTRRKFLQQATAGGALAFALRTSSLSQSLSDHSQTAGSIVDSHRLESKPTRPDKTKGDKLMIPIIDTHQHLWDLTKLHLAWVKEGDPLASNHVLSDYKRATEGINIVSTVYMEVDALPDQRVKEAEYVFDLCHQPHSLVAGAVIGGNPLAEGFKEYVEKFVKNSQTRPYFKGVRQVLHGDLPKGTCLKPEFVAGMHLLADHNLVYDLCLRPTEIMDGAALARQCPHTRFVLDHCGNAPIYNDPAHPDREAWQAGVREIAQLPNVVCKISGIIAQLKPGDAPVEQLTPSILTCVENFGHDRIMFAGDWPVCTLGSPLKGWIGALQTIVHSWSEADKRKLFHDNAHRYYGIKA